MENEDTKFLSRKFILTGIVLLMVGGLPLIYKANGVSETVTMTVLCLLGAVGAAYGFMNVKEAQNEIKSKIIALTGTTDDSTSSRK